MTSIPLRQWPRLDFFAGDLPSVAELEFLVNRYSDEESRELFFQIHCWIMSSIREFLRLPGAYQEGQIVEELCDRSGYSYSAVHTAMLRRAYYRRIFDKFITSPKTAQQLVESQDRIHYPGLARLQSHILKSARTHCDTFPEYAKAEDLILAFLSRIESMAEADPVVRGVLNQWYEIRSQNMKTSLQVLNADKSVRGSFECPFCNRLRLFDRGSGVSVAPPHCGDDPCRKAYEASKKLKRRIIQSESCRWVKAFDTPRRCLGCRKQKFLNSDRLCRKCHGETLSE